MVHNKRMTVSELMEYYYDAGARLEGFAEALQDNFADEDKIMQFYEAAEQCHTLYKLYDYVNKKNTRYHY